MLISLLYCEISSLSFSRWHYTCINLQAIIANGFSPPDSYEYNGVHILDGFGVYADEDPASRGFYVDEFSFSHFARTLDIEVYMGHSIWRVLHIKG